MKVLLVKMTSLGDILHTLPAVTEAADRTGVRFDWLVEETFADIPRLHPAVEEVIPVALRRWRRAPGSALRSAEWRALRKRLKHAEYDLVLDAQGLLKSAAMVAMTRAPSAGFDRRSAREGLAARFYGTGYAVARDQHAVERLRSLFAQALGYPVPASRPDYGLSLAGSLPGAGSRHLVLLSGSSWETKRWPTAFWQALAGLAADAGYAVQLPWGSDAEHQTARDVADVTPNASVLPAMRLGELAEALAGAAGAIGVDGGPSHLAVAAGVPTVMLYSASDPERTGPWGAAVDVMRVAYECAPCLRRRCRFAADSPGYLPCQKTVSAQSVWQGLSALLPPGAVPQRGRCQ